MKYKNSLKFLLDTYNLAKAEKNLLQYTCKRIRQKKMLQVNTAKMWLMRTSVGLSQEDTQIHNICGKKATWRKKSVEEATINTSSADAQPQKVIHSHETAFTGQIVFLLPNQKHHVMDSKSVLPVYTFY